MKRHAGAIMLLSVLGGCVSSDKMSPGPQPFGQVSRAREVPGAQGPMGQPVPQYAANREAPKTAQSGIVQTSATVTADSGVQQAGMHPKDCNCAECTAKKHGLKHGGGGEARILGGHKYAGGGVNEAVPGAVAAVGALPGIPMSPGAPMGAGRTSIRFTGPAGMQVAWFAPSPESKNGFTPTQVEVPGRYNFVQGGIYRLKLTNIPNRAIELYPTLEVMPSNARTATFIAHSSVPVGFTEEDFEQVIAGNLVVKVVYLPNPEFQELAVAGPDEVVSTRLEPGVDPIMEATRRGSVLAVVRMGNIDLEAPNTPGLHTPPMMPGMGGMPLQVPPGGIMPGAMPPGPAMPGMMPPRGPFPPGAMPPGAPIPGAMPGPIPSPYSPTPPPAGAIPTPVPPGGTLPPPPPLPISQLNGAPAGRATVSSPADAPSWNVPPPPPIPMGQGSATVEGVFGRMK
jgi:hypothetical protein